MCGIAGILGVNNEKKVLSGMDNMLASIRHRGPDNTGCWSDDFVTLGHNRLSIIDLNQNAAQPMHSDDGRYVIVFNGEIYNYRELRTQYFADKNFSTKSDTEVLLAAYAKWGKAMLTHLNGMFAFAIWDKQNHKLFAARDRFGVKPFYYCISRGQFVFASEIKALWAYGVEKTPDFSVWAKYFSFGSYGLPNETFWTSVYQLPAGHILEVSTDTDGTIQQPAVSKWYHFDENIKNQNPLTEAEFKEQYIALLNESIQLRFRADVPVGFNVSGGLDSSTLLALINRQFNRGIEAFTFYTGNSDYDELPWVRELIARTGNPLNEVRLFADEIPDLACRVSAVQDEPFGGIPTLAYSKNFGQSRKKGIIVLLDGQGMDEAWAGYDYYHTQTGFTVQGTNTSPVRPEVLTPDFANLGKKEIYPEPFDNKLMNLQYRDLFYTKIPRALRFNDRISMLHSTELREPFLDYRLVELAFAQPAERKVKDGQTKYLLRHLSNEVLGDKIALAPKRPLQTPQREWLANDLILWVENKINDFAETGLVEKKMVKKIWTDYLEGDNENSFFIWQWINTAEILRS